MIDNHYALNAQDVLIVPPRKMHKIIYPERQNYIRYVFYFTQDHIEKAFSPSMVTKALLLIKDQAFQKVSLSLPEFIRMNVLFRNMYEHRKEMNPKNLYLLTAYSSVILQELYFIFTKHPAKVQSRELTPVEKILKYINNHYSENITLEDLEEKFFLNKSYICRIFRNTMGISLINYVQHKRILEAQQLLLSTDESIINISLECGFSNIQHFYRVFKKVTTLTPNEYRKHQASTRLGQIILPHTNTP